jgi:hypothetical protein
MHVLKECPFYSTGEVTVQNGMAGVHRPYESSEKTLYSSLAAYIFYCNTAHECHYYKFIIPCHVINKVKVHDTV